MHRLTLPLILAWSGLLLSAPRIVEAQSGPDKRLLQKTSVQVDAKPVEDVLRELGEKHKLTVEFDPSVAAEGNGKSPFSLTADGLTLGSVIHLACDSANLVYVVDKGRLLVTTRAADENILIAREYSLAPLGAVPDPQVLAAGLMEVTSGKWEVVNGEGGSFVAISPRSMTIRQSRAAHAELQSLFEQIAAAATGRGRAPSAQDRAEQTIVRKLQTPTQLPAGPLAVSEVLDQLLKKNGVPFWVDVAAMEADGIDWTKATSTIEGKKMPTAARLDAVLNELELSWRVADEVVQITTRVKASEHMVARVYDVRRLITPNRSLNALALQLTNTKELGPWAVTDGEGGSLMKLGTLLVVRHNAGVHSKLAGMLK